MHAGLQVGPIVRRKQVHELLAERGRFLPHLGAWPRGQRRLHGQQYRIFADVQEVKLGAELTRSTAPSPLFH